MNETRDGKSLSNGPRLSSSLLQLQPHKVLTAEAKSVSEKDSTTKRYSYNSAPRLKDSRTYSSPGLTKDKAAPVPSPRRDCEMPLLANKKIAELQINGHGNSMSCDNIFESPMLEATSAPGRSTPQNNSPTRLMSADYDPSAMHGNSLPKPITRSSSKEILLGNDWPNNAPTEQKRLKPKKPNRESLRRSRPDIRASQPNLPVSHRTSVANYSPDHNATTPTIMAGHDYEELNTDPKRTNEQKPHTPSIRVETATPLRVSLPDVGATPSLQNQSTPALPERTRNPRQRMNPLYAGMHCNPYDREAASGETSKKNPPDGCLRCLAFGVFFAVFFSILATTVVSLMLVGILEPSNVFGKSSQSDIALIENMQREIAMLKNFTNRTDATINDRLLETKYELLDAVKSLNLSALKGPDTADVAKCLHKSIDVGSSPSFDEIRSGDYFPEKGKVTTAVVCSAPVGYIAHLQVTDEDYLDSDNVYDTRTVYQCVCHKTTLASSPASTDRVSCVIHYWECPVL